MKYSGLGVDWGEAHGPIKNMREAREQDPRDLYTKAPEELYILLDDKRLNALELRAREK
tara:strand:- start:447 stop:623 length:177 start_codon:yes stop_codon:yes gene_type:complete